MSAEHIPTLFLDASDVARLVNGIGIEITLQGLAQFIESDFLRWPEFDKSARSAAHSPVGVIELMPASDQRLYAFKYVNGHPGNARLGLPTVMAFGVLSEVATGLPLLLADMTLLTALRTAAVSAVAARTLARKPSRTMAMIGTGAQAEFQALAFAHLVGVQRLRLWDIDAAAMQRVAARMQARGLQVECCSGTGNAVAGADIVTTATADKRRAAVLLPQHIAPGMHLNAIGGDCPGKTELHPDVVRKARVFVEYEPQTRVEGEIQQMPPDFAVTELAQVLAGAEPGRMRDDEVTLFDSVGFALEDYSALRWVHEQARERGVGRPIALVPRMDDAKDLYRLLLSPPAA